MLEAVGQSTGGCPESPIWWQAPAATQGNWHLCLFVLEVAVKVTRASVSLSWNALSWELVIWQKFQNQKNTSTPNNSEIKPGEGGRKGDYFMLWKLFSFRLALSEGDKCLRSNSMPSAWPHNCLIIPQFHLTSSLQGLQNFAAHHKKSLGSSELVWIQCISIKHSFK